MSCEKILDEICAELAEDIDSDVCQRLKQHLTECPECARQLQTMRSTVHLFALLKEKEVPEKIHERLAMVLNIPCEEITNR